MSGEIFCPLCHIVMAVRIAYHGGSGEYRQPYASCSCGFSFKPQIPRTGRAGESGWDIDGRHANECYAEIQSKFSRKG